MLGLGKHVSQLWEQIQSIIFWTGLKFMNTANTQDEVDYLFHFLCPLSTLAIFFPSNLFLSSLCYFHTYTKASLYIAFLLCPNVQRFVELFQKMWVYRIFEVLHRMKGVAVLLPMLIFWWSDASSDPNRLFCCLWIWDMNLYF